uniref:Phosphatidylinositol-specific phospholipase C X domain-containing protein n=1 Tax=Oryzias latipes TaxID=8090 RepID=A0A3P9HLW7_ORYLA
MLHSTANFPSFSDLKDSTVRKTVGCRYDRVLSYFHFICRRRSSGTASEGCGERMKENSDWMSKLPPNLHTVPLFNLAIPGSHDSMSFDLDVNSSIVEPDQLRRFSRFCCVRKLVHRWGTTQEVNIKEQLDAGVRYFDLRIARKPKDTDPNRLYFYHGLYTRTEVETVFRDINEWAEKHRKEVLILSLSHFKGFDKFAASLHNHLIHFIKTLFGAKLVPKTDKPTLKTCWDHGRNVIVSYDHPAYQQTALWTKIKYYYADSMDRAVVVSTLSHVLETGKPSNCFFVCGLNLTLPVDRRVLKYVLRICDNFPNVVRRGLPQLLLWVQQQSAKTPFNIVASDVVTRSDFVSTIIQLNWKHQKA